MKKTTETTTEAPKIQPISSRTRAAATTTKPSDPAKPTVTKKLSKQSSAIFAPPQPKTKSKPFETGVITTLVKPKQATEANTRTSRRISNEFEQTGESLYVSALEDIPSDVSRFSTADKTSSSSSDGTLSPQSSEDGQSESEVFTEAIGSRLPLGVDDFDKENWNDPYQVSNYAQYIFEYLKSREHHYRIKDYMNEQPEISKWMRSLLVDWMVEVQESFELNHETLYLAVKIVDTYLGKERVSKDALQLLGAASLLIACKYDVSWVDFSLHLFRCLSL